MAVSLLLYGFTSNKVHRKKARWELHKNTTSYLKQILEATPHETTAVLPLTSHLKNHPQEVRTSDISDILLWTSTHGCTSVGQPARTYISSLWTVDVLRKTCWEQWLIGTDGERERERERERESGKYMLTV